MKNSRISAFLISVFTLAILCSLVGAQARKKGGDPVSKDTYTLFASGDTALARWVHNGYYEKGPKRCLLDLKDLISGADIAMTNLECVVASCGTFGDKGERRPFLYRGRPELLDIITEVGFDVAVVANNHSGDYGPDAFLEELELLKATGMAAVGGGRNKAEASTPTYVQAGDVIVAFLGAETKFPKFAATDTSPGNFYAKEYSNLENALKEPIAVARKHADLVVFTPHWGDNWTDEPTGKRRKLARAIIDMGVDAILGHSAHHIHGIEIYKGRPIVYDMGSFFFDTVMQKRMRLGAGYVLTFSKAGFTKLTIHPLKLHSNRTVFAKGAVLEKIHKLLIDLTAGFGTGVAPVVEGDTLVFSFSPEVPPTPPTLKPENIHKTGQTRKLPQELRSRKTNVVFDTPPGWTEGFDSIPLDNGVTIIGARNPEAVWPRRAFTAEIALKVPGPLEKARWEASIRGVQRDGEETFVWRHPIADGGWLPYIWEPGQIVVDRTLVRPKTVPEGTYDLYWRFENLSKRTHAAPVNKAQGDSEGFVHIGEILITRENIPSGPAGVSWDGMLPPKGEVHPQMEPGVPLWPFFAGGGAVLLIIIVVVVLVLKKRAKKKK